jgi:hypothetical protein
VLSAPAQTISLELKNGDRITGQVLSETNGRVTLSNSFASQMSIPLGEITRRLVIPPTNAPLVAVVATNTPVVSATNVPVAAVSTNALAKTNAVSS